MERKYVKTRKLLVGQIMQKEVTAEMYLRNPELFEEYGYVGYRTDIDTEEKTFKFNWHERYIVGAKLSDLVKLYEIIC